MKLVMKGIETILDCSQNRICTVVIENQKLFYEVVEDIERQMQGLEGESVLSENNQILKMDKYAEQLIQFVPFDLNKKSLLSRITAYMQKIATDEIHYETTSEFLSVWEKFCMELEFELPVGIEFTKINIDALLKASGIMISDDYDSLAEKILDYIHLIEYFECKKLFILVNVRSFIGNEEMQRFVDTVLARGYQIVLLDNKEYSVLKNEKRCLIDADMCEICYNS